MKNRYLASFAALVALLLLPLASYAQVTTLLSEGFTQSESFPPSGWSANSVGQNSSYGGWYESGGGNGGSYGSYGSAVADDFYAEQTACYGGNYGTITLTSPTVSCNSADSQFVDFDVWFPYNYYEYYYSPYVECCFSILSGTNVLTTVNSLNTNIQWSDINYAYNDPVNGYTSSNYWAHYHVALPHGASTQSVTFEEQPYYNTAGGSYCYFGDMYVDNIAFTNVVISNVHHSILTVTGPTNINFGSVPVGLSAGPYYCVLANPNASSSITLSNYVLGGTNPGDFTITRMPTTILAGKKDSVGVFYAPKAAGARSGTVTLSANAQPATVTINLSGQGLTPDVSYSSTTMFRGVTTEETDTSGIQYLYVNSSGGVPLIVTGVSFYGVDARAYYITHLPGGAIAPGGVDSIGVRFVPDLEGLPDAHMVVNSNAANSPSDTVALYGVGILPHLAIDSGKSYPLPAAVNFDSVKLGSDSAITVVLWNPGSDTVAIEQNFFESDDPDFTFVPLTGRDTLIAPGATQNISIVFTPTQQGTREATIRIRTDIPHTETNPARDTSQFVINVIGVGVPTGKLEITGPLTNGNTNVGTPVTVADTFWNTGNASLTVTYVGISGTNANDFTATYPSVPFTIPGNSNLPFTVTAKPIDSGLETALLTASGTSSETPVVATHALAVYGLLIADTAIVTVPFASESCGSDTMTVTVTNTGNVPESYTASIPLNTNFKVLGSGISPTESNDSVATFLVVFTPTSNTPATGTLNIVGGQSIPPIALSATAGAATIAGTQAAPMTAIGQTSADFTVTVNNTGTCPWTTGTPTVDPQFTYVSGAGTIAAGGSAPFVFTYTPNVAGGASYPVTFLAATGATTAPPNVMITTALDDVAPASESNGFSLNQNYPNPFSQTSSVEITLPVASLVHLSIIDVQGQVVETLLNQHYDAGSFSVTLDATGLASGTYYYQMTAGNVTLTRQMVILK